MTFDEWWNEWGVEMAHLPEKSAAKKAWEAATLAEREECAKVCDEFDSENPHIGQATAVGVG